MEEVKTRKQGNSVMITIASKFGVKEGTSYYVNQEEDGTIILIPKIEDYFNDVSEGQFVDDEDELAREFSVKDNMLDD